jgi:hypothetical protein
VQSGDKTSIGNSNPDNSSTVTFRQDGTTTTASTTPPDDTADTTDTTPTSTDG